MQYTLITKQGRVMTFYVKAVADLYQSINGGVVITQQILVDATSDLSYN
jgi:hypothetical protein